MLVSQTSIHRETAGGGAKCCPFSQAILLLLELRYFSMTAENSFNKSLLFV